MVEAYFRRSPLNHLGLAARASADPAGADIVLAERPHRCQIVLRGDAGDPAFTAALHGATGLVLSAAANSFVTEGDLSCLWLGPDEWLIVGPGGGEGEVTARLRVALAGLHAAVTDISEARTTIAISGAHARDLMAKAVSLDLHPRVFGPGHCAQTGFAGANIILRQLDDVPSFEIFVLNSFAEHVWRWIEGGCREFRVAIAVH